MTRKFGPSEEFIRSSVKRSNVESFKEESQVEILEVGSFTGGREPT